MKQQNKIIFITGTDGAGKSSLASSLHEYYKNRGVRSCVSWSRFHNYFSKPLLALARISGHNYYKEIDFVKFGFHDFSAIPVFGQIFSLLQAIDVNISAFFNITKQKSNYEVIICERGPWDTLCDVMVDTGLKIDPNSMLGKLYLLQTAGGTVFYIKRSEKNILITRPELVHDYKLSSKIENYNYLSSKSDWIEINNNTSLQEANHQLLENLIQGE